MGRFLFLWDLETLNVGGNVKVSGTIPSGIKNYRIGYDTSLWTSTLQLVNISGTNLLYDEDLCDLPEFLCDASLPLTVAPSPSSVSSSFCIELRIKTDIGYDTSWKITG